MKILILEDELPAYNKIFSLVNDHIRDVKVLGWARTKEEGRILLEKEQPDLIFSDIELLDGLSFDLFDEVGVTCPIIFCTAYDQYLFKAFQTNGIAYLLKPYDDEAFLKVYKKYKKLFNSDGPIAEPNRVPFSEIKEALRSSQNSYKQRFTVKKNKGIMIVKIENVVSFEAQGDFSFLYDSLGSKYVVNYSLGTIDSKIDPIKFFRINRSDIVNINHIEKIEAYSKNRLHITLKGGRKVLTSESKTSEFRKWIDG